MGKHLLLFRSLSQVGQRFFLNSIRKKIFAVIILVLIGPMATSMFYALMSFSRFIERQAHEKVHSDLVSLAGTYENKQKEMETFARTIAVDNAVKVAVGLERESLSGKQLSEYLGKMLSESEAEMVTVTDGEGIVIARGSNPNAKDDDLSSSDLVKRALKGESKSGTQLISEEELSKEGLAFKARPKDQNLPGALVIQASSPIHKNEKVTGVVLVGCLINHNPHLASVLGDKPRKDFVVLQKDMVVLSNIEDIDEDSVPLYREKVNLVMDSEEKLSLVDEEKHLSGRIYGLGDRDYLTHFSVLRSLNGEKVGSLMALKELESIISFKKQAIFGMALGFLLVLGLAIFSAIFFGYRLTQPLNQLVKGTQRIAHGDLYTLIEISSKDEIGILANSFNQMTTQLKKSKQEIEQYTRNLEDQVKARTLELEMQTERAVQADKLKSQFLANTSHELRTPLNSIIGFLGLILDGYCNDEKEQKEFIQNAHTSAKHLLSLINDVLDIAKIEAGKLELELEDIDLKALFEEINSLSRVQAEQKKLKMSFVCEDEFVPNVYADLGRLKQVMLNLIGNAIKFTDKGSITIRTKVQREKGNVLIQVEDTGVGVQPEMQDNVFEKFSQVDSSPIRKQGGTGLGLTITKTLVEMMGGKIKLESPGMGKGSRVSFTMPISQKAGKDGEYEKEKSLVIKGNENNPLVLIVEDDPGYARYLEKILQEDGFSTIWAATADDAVYAAQNYHPLIMTLDYSLPPKRGGILKDGRDIIQELQKDNNTRNIETIIITGQDEDQVKKELAFDVIVRTPEVLEKPIDAQTLKQKIQFLFDRPKKERLNILVVDDDPLMRKFVTTVLKPDGYTIYEAIDGQQACDFISKNLEKVDLVLLDLMMPEKSGIDVMRELKLERKAPDLPIIIITDYLETYKQQEKEFLSRKTVLEVLTKDALHKTPEILRKKIAQFIKRKREIMV
jgi:signal transduction histidine kinase/CheY-like chemotaxis protein